MFDTLRATKGYNDIIFRAIETMLDCKIDVCVFHIVGADNIIADALSCLAFLTATQHCPNLIIRSFKPPSCELGVTPK